MTKRNLIVFIAVAIILFFVYSFFQIENNENVVLSPIESFQINVPEPSGLYYEEKTATLWTVSDETSRIYNIDTRGNLIDSIEVNGFDLEGIAIIQDSIIAAILERDRKVLLLDKRGNEISSFTIDISGESNKGIEGITYSSKENIIYIINEKKPRVLIKADLSGKIIMKIPLDFAKDFSGLHYDENSGLLWIISDEDSAIYICTTEGVLIQKVRLNIEQIEGIALDNVNSLVYIVSDPLEKLYIFKLQ